jgi:hypothetical protein
MLPMKLSTTLVLELKEGSGGVKYDSQHGSRTQFPTNRKHTYEIMVNVEKPRRSM